MPGLLISEIVRVSATIVAGGAARRDHGVGLFLTVDDTLPAGGSGKARRYASFAEVAKDFDAGSEPYAAATAWFGQASAKNLLIGRWATADVATSLVGGTPAAIATLTAITNGSFNISGNDVDGVSFAGASTYAAQATILQTAIQAISDARFTGATVTYAAGAFEIELSGASDIDPFLGPHSSGTGTDISAPLGLDADSSPTYRRGSDQEGAADALDAIGAIDGGFYFVLLDNGAPDTLSTVDTKEAVAAWAQAGRYLYSMTAFGASALVANETTSGAAVIAALGYDRVFITWSQEEDYRAVSIAGRLSAMNLNLPRSLITAKFRQLPGFESDALGTSERRELGRKRVNFYADVEGTPIYTEGYTTSTSFWIDVRFWLDWLVNHMERGIFNRLVAVPRVAQTSAGVEDLREAAKDSLEQGVRNGGLAPNEVSSALASQIRDVTGNADFDGNLTLGYLLYVGSLAAQSQGDRDDRQSPPFSIWLKGSGAIHFIEIGLTFEN